MTISNGISVTRPVASAALPTAIDCVEHSSSATRIKRLLSRFTGNKRGNITVLTALSIIPIIGAVGGTIDYGRVFSERTKSQFVLDAAVLAGARGLLIENLGPPIAVEARVRTHADTQFAASDLHNISYTVSVANKAITALGTKTVETPFLSLVGIPTLSFNIRSQAVIADINLEVSLVVDTTGSIRNNGHIGSISSALRDLVNDLEPIDPKLSIVPFSETVNLGANWQASWIDSAGQSPTHGIMFDQSGGPVVHDTLFASMGKTWNGCVEMRALPFDVTDDAPSGGDPSTLWVPFFGPSVNPHGNYLLNGYETVGGIQVVRDITQYSPANLSNAADPSHAPDKFDPLSNCNRNPLIPLTNDQTLILATIDTLDFDGGTNIPSGLAWGWRTLSPGEPFTEGAAYGDPKNPKIMVLLSDGKNEMAVEYNGYGMFYDGRLGQSGATWTEMPSLLNARMQELCSNIKSAGIKLYIISYALADDADTLAHKSIMSQCASNQEYHFDAETPTALREALIRIVELETPIRLVE